MENFAKHFFDIVTTYNDEICYVKHVLAPLYVFFTLFGWGGLPSGLGHNLLMQFSRLSSSKLEISETDFFDTLTIQNDQISYVKHVLAPLYVFFALPPSPSTSVHRLMDSKSAIPPLCVFHSIWVMGAPKGSRAQPACAVFSPHKLKNRNFRNCFFFLIL